MSIIWIQLTFRSAIVTCQSALSVLHRVQHVDILLSIRGVPSKAVIECHIRCICTDRSHRGIPSGYLSYIEQRLLETECVVLELLTTLYKLQSPVDIHRLSEQDRRFLAESAQKQPKSAKIEEWKQAPLLTDDQKYAWWVRRQNLLTSSEKPDLDSISNSSPAMQDPWPTASPASVQLEDVHSNDTLQSRFQTVHTPKAPEEMWQSSPGEIPISPHATFSNNAKRFSVDASSTMNPMASEPAGPTLLAVPQPTTEMEPPAPPHDKWRKYF
jgi:hypothetical protein